jgi:Outer membrane protein beta-barrel domain
MRHPLAARQSTINTKNTGRLAALVIVTTFVVAPAPAVAQHRQFGAKVGPSFTGISLPEDDGQAYHARIAAALGGFFVLPLRPPVSLQFEAMSSPKGTRVEEPGSNLTQTLLLRYFEMPVLLRVTGPKLRGGATYFIAGPFFGIRVNAKEQFSTRTNGDLALGGMAVWPVTGVRADVPDSIERFESGLIAGAGIDIGKYVLLEGRYSHGLTNANNFDGRTSFTNRGFSFTTGVRF